MSRRRDAVNFLLAIFALSAVLGLTACDGIVGKAMERTIKKELERPHFFLFKSLDNLQLGSGALCVLFQLLYLPADLGILGLFLFERIFS